MLAEYHTSATNAGNPYVEALPSMLSGRQLIEALAVFPPYSTEDRLRSDGERLQLLSNLYEVYQPLPMTIDLYCQVYNTILHSYSAYTPQGEALYSHCAYSAIHSGTKVASIGGGSSFSLVGVSGLGKSTALQRHKTTPA